MTEINELVKLAVDAYSGNVEKYSVSQAQDTLREALIEANGGSTVLNYKNIRDGKCNGLFAIIEEILSNVVIEGLAGDEFFNALVDFRNVAEGDENTFVVEDSNLFVISDVADGTQGIRRQRLAGSTEAVIPTSMKMVRIYEELNRVLSGRVDFNHLINKVSESFRQKILNDVYTLWSGATYEDLGGIEYFPAAGGYDEDELLEVIAHVEAAAGGKTATIVGTKKALKPLMASVKGEDGKNTIDNLGYVGKFYGSNVVAMPQRHEVGTKKFIFSDKVLHIIAGDDKPIKFRATHNNMCAA